MQRKKILRRKFKGHKYSFNFTNLACELIHILENPSKNCLIKSTRKINFFLFCEHTMCSPTSNDEEKNGKLTF